MTVYGLIEWDVEVPTLIVGTSRETVERAAFDQLKSFSATHFVDAPNFDRDHPAAAVKTAEDVKEWLDAMHEETTVPWFTILDNDQDVIHTA